MALRISNHKRGTSHCNPPSYSTGSFANRCTSSVVITPAWRCAKVARPLSAPKSKARYVLVGPPLGIRRDASRVTCRPFLRNALEIAVLTERLQGVGWQPFRNPPFLDGGPYIRRESVLQYGLGSHQIGVPLCFGKLFVINKGRFRIELLR